MNAEVVLITNLKWSGRSIITNRKKNCHLYKYIRNTAHNNTENVLKQKKKLATIFFLDKFTTTKWHNSFYMASVRGECPCLHSDTLQTQKESTDMNFYYGTNIYNILLNILYFDAEISTRANPMQKKAYEYGHKNVHIQFTIKLLLLSQFKSNNNFEIDTPHLWRSNNRKKSGEKKTVWTRTPVKGNNARTLIYFKPWKMGINWPYWSTIMQTSSRLVSFETFAQYLNFILLIYMLIKC